MPQSRWTVESIPLLIGKLVVVTGGTGGLGYETALVLAQKGATVILLGRSEEKGAIAIEKTKSSSPNAKVSFEKVDFTSLASISEFGRRFNSQHEVLDLLINNAGIFSPPKRETTGDGFEKVFATNHLAHFALTALLLPALKRSTNPRVVNVSSLAHRRGGQLNFDDLQFEKNYNSWTCYSRSKLANLLFTFELQKRSDEGKWGLFCTSAHPGYARTEMTAGPTDENIFSRSRRAVMQYLLSHSAADGALPTIYAATSPDAVKGGYYGPDGFYEIKGAPTSAYLAPEAKDEEVAKKLWEVSISMTGAKWD